MDCSQCTSTEPTLGSHNRLERPDTSAISTLLSPGLADQVTDLAFSTSSVPGLNGFPIGCDDSFSALIAIVLQLLTPYLGRSLLWRILLSLKSRNPGGLAC